MRDELLNKTMFRNLAHARIVIAAGAAGYNTERPHSALATRPRLTMRGPGPPQSRHLAYFILIGLYTGTRKDAVLGLAFILHTRGGRIDCDKGVLYRRSDDARVTKKRQTPVQMPTKLLGHMRRLQAHGQRFAVEFRRDRVGDIKTALARACQAAGIEGATPHTLRHTAITRAMQAGVPLADASAFFGVTVDILEKVCFHHSPAFRAATAEAMKRA